MEKSVILTITTKVPKEWKGAYTGVCLSQNSEQTEPTLFFGFRGPVNSNLCGPHGNCIQKAANLMQRHGYEEVILHVDAEFMEYKQPAKFKITLEE